MAGTNRYKLATWKFYYCLKWSCYLQNIFVNPCEFLGLCWVVFRSRNFADAKRKEVVCITLGFFPNSASGNGIWALGSGISKKNGLGNGTGTPPSGPSLHGHAFSFRSTGLWKMFCFQRLLQYSNLFTFSALKWNKLFLDLALLASRRLPLQPVSRELSELWVVLVLSWLRRSLNSKALSTAHNGKTNRVDPGRPQYFRRRKGWSNKMTKIIWSNR